MQLFLLIALAHFLALLSPGPDFFLITRTAITYGWKTASATCLGIALANGLFILLAFTGLARLNNNSSWFVLLQLAGCVYLLYLGCLFIRYAGTTPLMSATTQPATAQGLSPDRGLHALLAGLLSGLLNPKNLLFYASLALVFSNSQDQVLWKMFCGLWMFMVVLLWDLLIAAMIGNRLFHQHFARLLPWIERGSGVVLFVMACGIAAMTLSNG